MNVHDYLSDNGQAMLLLCSAFALPGDAPPTGPAPFKLSEWNQLARKIHGSPLASPAALAGRSAADLTAALKIAPDEAARIAGLLEYGGRAALELETLFSRGMWAVTRVDEKYPAQLRDTLKHQAPTVLFGAGDIQLLHHAGVAVVGSRDIDAAGTAFPWKSVAKRRR